MKKVILVFLGLFLATSVSARDDVGEYSIKEAMQTAKEKSVLVGGVDFFFGAQKHSKVTKNHGNFKTSKKTNAMGKSDKQACEWAFLSALKALEGRALREGANAVINIKSNYKNNLTSSTKTFQCGAGAFVAGVALTGDVVKLKK
jgi:uncharacterized protein YbjQ (UPF0145 family)